HQSQSVRPVQYPVRVHVPATGRDRDHHFGAGRAAFHPVRADASVLVLNALLGLGTTLAPVFVAIFVGLGFWWGLPVLSSVLLLALIAVSAGLPLRAGAPGVVPAGRTGGIPPLFWVFAAFAVLYGFCETMNGNWSQLDMTKSLHATVTQASFA